MASRRASDSSSWAKATIDARYAWPSDREWKSMADESKTKGKPAKSAKSDKAARPEKPGKGDKPQQAQAPQKAQKSGKPEKAEKPQESKAPPQPKSTERVIPRMKTHFEEVVRKKLADEF